MPNLATNLPDDDALKLIAAWIESLGDERHMR